VNKKNVFTSMISSRLLE